MRYFLLLLFMLSFISGCSTKPRQEPPATIIESVAVTRLPTSKDGSVTVTPLKAPASFNAKPATNKAVQLLHDRANAQMNTGDFTAAAKSLERALSITPDNAQTWNLLAHLRAKEKKYKMAVEIAARSNSLISADEIGLKKDNLLLISKMKTSLGDHSGASKAKLQANSLN